jgi:hypothetical protein
MNHFCSITGYTIDTTPHDDEVGEEYLRQCEQDAKDNPSIHIGMLVMVYLYGAWDTRGRVLSLHWYEQWGEHSAEVELVGGGVEDIWISDLRPVSYSGSTLYALLKQRTIQGGQA